MNNTLKNEIDQIFYTDNNYQIIDMPSNKKIAIIYFSSGGLYKWGDIESFSEKIIKNNRYEWQRNMLKTPAKHIFVRDIYMQWYLNGINQEINTIDKLLEWLKQETKGYKVITIGLSSGGYIAMLSGHYLSAEYVISFSGQIDILDYQRTGIPYCDLTKPSIKKYLSISKILETYQTDIFYFAAINAPNDFGNIELSKNLPGFHVFQMDTERHEMPINIDCLSKLINLNKENLINIYKKNKNIKINLDDFSQIILKQFRLKQFVFNILYTATKHLIGLIPFKKLRKKLRNKIRQNNQEFF